MPGWVNADIETAEGIVSSDILDGLPFETCPFNYVVSMHALPELSMTDQVPGLRELRRVLCDDGVLRLGLPDLDRAIDAHRREERTTS